MQKEKITSQITANGNDLVLLKKHFPHCFDKNGDFDFDKFKNQLQSNKIDFSKESYSMDWLGKSYARLLASDPATTLLREDIEWNSKEDNRNSENLLLKGDNLEVLKHLSNAYHEKIKMIYIDPPYNTGSDGFVYEDDRTFTVNEFSKLAGVDTEQAKKILSFVKAKSNSHSAWLTFMYPRLYIARQLLKDDGVIFVSIDDNEVAQLRILMDEVFGEENFIGSFIWNKKLTGGYDNENINTQHEYLLMYCKNSYNFSINYDEKETKYKLKDTDGRYYKWDSLWNIGGLTYSKSLDYPIIAPDGQEVWPPGDRGVSFWLWSKEKVQRERDSLKFEKNKSGTWKVYKKVFASSGIVPGSMIGESILNKEIVKGNTHSSREVKVLFNDKKLFDYAKPTTLIKYIVDKGSDSNEIILDFFAGSGTTGDAVMQLNAEDRANRKEGARKYILVQLPETIDPKTSKPAYDFVKNDLAVQHPTIFDITKERLIRAGTKIYSEAQDKEILKDIDFGFKIFETTPIWENYELEADEFDPQATLFDESKLTADDIQTLLTTWKTYDGISLTQDLEAIDLGGYIAYYGANKLYLMDKGFGTENLKKLIEKVDIDTDFSPSTIIAFGYHFESKVLREIAENTKNYSNKKNTEIDFVIRY
jgi:adenine-specific DNA-methyltransferase